MTFYLMPLEDATFSEVLARVAFRYAEADYRKLRRQNPDVAYDPGWAARDLATGGFPHLACYLAAMLYHKSTRGGPLRQQRNTIIVRARLAAWHRERSQPWRRVR